MTVWADTFLDRLRAVPVQVHAVTDDLAPARLARIPRGGWEAAAELLQTADARLAALWGEETDDGLRVNACFERDGIHLVLRADLHADAPEIASLAPWFPAADRLERHAQDLLGLRFTGHPDPRKWTRHGVWQKDEYPLRRDFPAAGREETATSDDYPFRAIHGAGVCEIPVGPVHAGIIEPGHFRFHAVGEQVLSLEERLGYVHKGIEKGAVGRDAFALARLAGRVSGDSTVAHAWAACQAMERAAGIAPPPRALHLRALMAERERIANHLGDIGAICNDVGFGFAWYQFSRLRELWQRASQAAFGHRLMMDCVTPGGVACDVGPDVLARMAPETAGLREVLARLYAILGDHPSLEDRLIATGVLAREEAVRLGCLGYVGRASGIDYDLRRDATYAPYDVLPVRAVTLAAGDVQARMRVRQEEILAALDLVDLLAATLPTGEVRVGWRAPTEGTEGLGLVEGWRGEVLCHVRFGADGRIVRFFPRDPSWFNWPALEYLINGNIVPDFPVCNKSVNGSYSGQDL